MSNATRFSLLFMIIILALTASVVTEFFMVRYQVDHSQRQWCATLRLLTEHPVPKPANPAKDPSRYVNWQVYSGLVTLKSQFHC